jgi:hypothetical protein
MDAVWERKEQAFNLALPATLLRTECSQGALIAEATVPVDPQPPPVLALQVPLLIRMGMGGEYSATMAEAISSYRAGNSQAREVHNIVALRLGTVGEE